jgi:hypothetical protein
MDSPSQPSPAEYDDLYPSLGLAFDQVNPSYQLASDRLNAANSRIEHLIGTAVTLTLAVPAFVAAAVDEPAFDSWWLYAAGGTFAVMLLLGLVARAVGGIIVISPAELYQGWLHLQQQEFRARLVYWSGEHFRRNLSRIWWKSSAATLMSILLVVEISLFVGWMKDTTG